MIVIGLGHKARQGKNYVADFMKAQDNRVKIYAFADELKKYCAAHHDELLPQWQLANQTKQVPACKEDPIYGYTKILQWYGTDVARKADPDTWVKALATRMEADAPEIAVVTDVRFPNEAEYVKKAGGFMVEVIRLNQDGTQFVDPGRDPNHPSELALNDYSEWDFTILVRDGDLAGLKQKSIGVLNIVLNYDKYSIDLLNESVVVVSPDDLGMYPSYRADMDSDGTGFKE